MRERIETVEGIPMSLAIWPRLVAFKDRIVEAYIRGMAAEQAERHPVPPLGTCALCGRSEDAAEAHARGVVEECDRWTKIHFDSRAEGAAEERKKWTAAIVEERRYRAGDDGGGYERVVLRSVLNRMGVGPV